MRRKRTQPIVRRGALAAARRTAPPVGGAPRWSARPALVAEVRVACGAPSCAHSMLHSGSSSMEAAVLAQAAQPPARDLALMVFTQRFAFRPLIRMKAGQLPHTATFVS
eukprot:scaffold27812_cov31-Tisochrysis_lutea.AAC.3